MLKKIKTKMANSEKPGGSEVETVESVPVVKKTVTRKELGLAKELLEERITLRHNFDAGSIEPIKIPPLKEGKIRTLKGTADGKPVNLFLSRENKVAYKEDGREVKWLEAAQKDANLLCELMLEGVIKISGIPEGSRRYRRLQYVLTIIASMQGGNMKTDREFARMIKELNAERFSLDEISHRKGAFNVLVAFQRAISGVRKEGLSIDDFRGKNPKYRKIQLTLFPQRGRKYRTLLVVDEDREDLLVAEK